MNVTGIILAGGKSRRMGEDKRFLPVGEATLLERVVSVMIPLFPEVLIVIAQDSPALAVSGCTVHRDVVADCGSLGGLFTGLVKAANQRVFVAACDMPFLNPDMIRWFLEYDALADIVMAALPSGLQPLHALYGKQALPVFERMVAVRELKIQHIASEPSLRTTLVTPAHWGARDALAQSFQNVNTPADLDAARAALRRYPSAQ